MSSWKTNYILNQVRSHTLKNILHHWHDAQLFSTSIRQFLEYIKILNVSIISFKNEIIKNQTFQISFSSTLKNEWRFSFKLISRKNTRNFEKSFWICQSTIQTKRKNFQKTSFDNCFFNMKNEEFVNTLNELSQSTQIFNFSRT